MKLIIRIETPLKINGEQIETGQAIVLNYGLDKHLIFKDNANHLINSTTYSYLIKTQQIIVL